VLPTLVQTVREALKLPYVAVTLQQAEEVVIVAEVGKPVADPLRLPLAYQGAPVGSLLLGQRTPGEAFGPTDHRLLADLARQAGVAVHGVRLTADLQRSRQRLVTAREEERRRLRRDLHDGLGPELASMTLQAEAARDRVSEDPARSEALLAELIGQLQAATAEIRRLVYELRPPALDDIGLVAAVRTQAARYDQGSLPGVRVTVETPACLPPLTAAVEVAAYRICQEALTNVVRHAGARQCAVRIALADDDVRGRALRVEISDDGRGLPAELCAGVGLASMRERAVELGGGTSLIEPLPTGGTRVVATLPLPAYGAQPLEAEGQPELPAVGSRSGA
jgi:signal transduction histidine kinase